MNWGRSASSARRRIVGEDALLEVDELGTRLESGRLDQVAAVGLERRQRVGRTSQPVQRQHVEPAQAIATRPAREGGFEVGDQAGDPPRLEPDPGQVFGGDGPQLVESTPHVEHPVLVRELAQHRTPPQAERPHQQLLALRRQDRALGLRDERLEPGAVHVVTGDVEDVSGVRVPG